MILFIIWWIVGMIGMCLEWRYIDIKVKHILAFIPLSLIVGQLLFCVNMHILYEEGEVIWSRWLNTTIWKRR